MQDLKLLIGNLPVSEQIDEAIQGHTHVEYVPIKEFEALKEEVRKLRALVGNKAVSEQISEALHG